MLTLSRLPNGEKAIFPVEKLSMYALNPERPVGKHKARVFEASLGLTQKDARLLQEKLRRVVAIHDATPMEPTPYGERFVIDFEIKTDSGTATVWSTWMMRMQA